MNAQSSKRVCLLTGASGRLGSVFCRAYHETYRIAAVYHDTPPHVWSQGCDAPNVDDLFPVRADLAVPDAPKRVVAETLTRFGTIDLLVNAAAVSRWAPIVGTGSVLDGLQDMLTLNAVVPLRMAAAVAQQYWCRARDRKKIGNPNIVNISSTASVYLYEGLGQSGYAASKAALNMLTCHLADEFAAFGVRANALAPNSFPSHVSTQSVAAAVVRLDKSDLTGRVLVLDSDGETLL